jgi:hypothetical protein
MVGNSRRRCSARSCFRAEDMEWADGGASAGTGVERPLQQLAIVHGGYMGVIPRLP